MKKRKCINSNVDVLPVALWQHIFSFACLDGGSTGRSLSLVSKHFRAISAPFKYRSVAITHWSQIIAFSKFFCKLPASQKKTISLFVHHPYPFLDINDHSSSTSTDKTYEQSESEDGPASDCSEDIQNIHNGSTLPECNDGDDDFEILDVEDLFADDWTSGGSDRSASDDVWDYSDGVIEWDSDFEGSLDEKEGKEILKDAEYLKAVRDGLLPHDGNLRDDNLRDADIQAFFDNVLQAFHAILNEISSTLQILAVYWTSFQPLQIHELLPPLPCLIELHINRSSVIKRDVYEKPPTTFPFPRLSFLYISGQNPRKLSFSGELARIAPNLAFLRFSMSHFDPELGDPKDPNHNFQFHSGRIIIETNDCSPNNCVVAEKRLQKEFGVLRHTVHLYLADVYSDSPESPEIWKKWWTSRMIGNVDDTDGPWRSPHHPRLTGRGM